MCLVYMKNVECVLSFFTCVKNKPMKINKETKKNVKPIKK